MFLRGNFYRKGKKFNLILKEQDLIWEPEGESSDRSRQSVHISEIICCWTCPSGHLTCIASESHENETECQHWKKGCGGISVEFCQRKDGHQWATRVISFRQADRLMLRVWYSCLWQAMKALVDRPRNLLVLINPVSGRKRANSVYGKKVSPLFSRARIQTSIMQTEYKGHGTTLIREAVTSGLLGCYDGIVAVGGDGLSSEVVTGLFSRSDNCREAELGNSHLEFPDLNLRLGIIPSGSTDATCFATHGCDDVLTAALHIIMGDRRAIDVASLHSNGQLQRVVTSLISYGLLGDNLQSSENMRWIGPPRYVLAGVSQIFKNKAYSVRIKVRKKPLKTLSVGNSSEVSFKSSQSCSNVCSVCTNGFISDDDESGDWEEVVGKYSIVSAAVTSCACRLTPSGVSPLAHLGDGCTDLILVKGSSRTKLLSYIFHTMVTGSSTNLDHVNVIRTDEIHLSTPKERGSSFNCDGEELESTYLVIKIHRQKLPMFCRGVENNRTSGNKIKS